MTKDFNIEGKLLGMKLTALPKKKNSKIKEIVDVPVYPVYSLFSLL